MISLKEIANYIYDEGLSPKEEKKYIDSIWLENEKLLENLFYNKKTYRKAIASEKLRLEDEDEFYMYINDIYKYKQYIMFSNSFKEKYIVIESVFLKLKSKALDRPNKKISRKMRTIVKKCGYKRRSKEFNIAVKDILLRNNMIMLYNGKVEPNIEEIDMNSWVTIIVLD